MLRCGLELYFSDLGTANTRNVAEQLPWEPTGPATH
jgi:hypothetical protein